MRDRRRNERTNEREEKKNIKTRQEETEGKRTKAEGGIPVSQQRAPSPIFAQDARNSTPAAGKFSFFSPLHCNYKATVAGECG
jgi:hypothetical protein